MSINTSDDAVYSALEDLATNGVPSEAILELIDVGNRPYRNFVMDDIVGGLTAGGGSTSRFILGDYGTGKTHLLRIIELDCLKAGLATTFIDISQNQNLERPRSFVQYILQNISVDFGQGRVRGLPNVLTALSEHSITDKAKLAGSTLQHPGFKAAMLQKLSQPRSDNPNPSALDRFLLGEAVTMRSLRFEDISGVRNHLSNTNAEYVMNTVFTSLSLLGLKGSAVFLDEHESTFVPGRRRIPRRIREAANVLRHLVDSCFNGKTRGLVAFFGVLPDFLDRIAAVYPALSERLRPGTTASSPSYRWPTITIQDISGNIGPDEFVEELADHFVRIVRRFAPNSDLSVEILKAEGMAVLARDAGLGVRRVVIKNMANTVLDEIGDY